jgi:uncharacterized protein (TIGR03437 family)
MIVAMFQSREKTRRFRASVCALVVRTASVGVASCAILSAQTLLNTRNLSGSANDTPTAIATDSQGNVYIAGATTSPDFPLTQALFAQLPEPALRVSTDGRTFVPATLSAPEVDSVAASSDGRLVLAATSAGLYRSIDGGATWAPSSTLTGQILALAVDPANSASAYAVVLTSSTFSMPAGPATNSTWTIYKSGDGGVTWQTSAAFTLSPVTAAVSRIVVNPLNSSIVYAFVNSALMRSADAGASWQQLNIPAAQANLGETNPTAFAIAPSQPNIAYATTYYFPLVKSFDGGVTWQPAAPIGAAGENALAVDPQNPSVVWLVDGVGIHKSTDGGATFQTAAAMGDGSWRSIAVSNVDSSQVFASDLHNVYATFDGGLTWTTVASGQINAVFALASQIYVAASVSPTVFLTKLDPTLTQIVYSTFIGPGSISHIAVDPAGNVYMAGTTESHLFPTTPGALGSGFASSSAGFVTKVRADGGALLYSTLLDGMPVNGIAIDAAGNAVIAGAATGAIPVTPNALQSTAPGPCTRNSNEIGLTVQVSTHAFAAKLNAGASAYLYATWLTGSCGDVATDVAIDSTGAAWVGGTTYSPDFATTANAMTGSFPTASDAGFVSQLSAAGDRLLYSTFVGSGSDTTVNALALDQQGNVVIAGAAPAQATSGSYQRPASSCPPVLGFFSTFSLADDDGFVMKLSPGSSAPLFLATIGGACQDYISRLAIDSAGDIWVSGLTFSSDFTTVAPFPNLGSASSSAGFLAALDPTGSALLSASISSNAGAVAAGPGGTVYYTEPLPVPSKTGSAVLIASIDATLPPAIALDQIHSFGPSQPLSPAYVPFNVAPGEAVRLIGRGIGPVNQADASAAPAHVLPGIAGVQVTFNGIVAQLVSVQANQIVCFVPFALDGATSANVQVTYAGAASNLYSIGVVPQNVDLVAVANQDGSLNSESNPAPVNSVAAIYLTGLGQTNPPSVDGALNTTPFVSPRTIPQIAVNGSPEQPVFLGAAVGQVAGVMQVNLFVPDAGASQSDAVYIGAAFLRIWTTPHP